MPRSIFGLVFLVLVATPALAQSEWELQEPSSSPPARNRHALAHDAARGVTVLFGGYDASTSLSRNDTWTWDGLEWTERFPARSPEPGYGHALVYCPPRGTTLLFGGLRETATGWGFRRDTWEWDGTDWRVVPTSVRPTARFEAYAAYDEKRGVIVLWGGATVPDDNDTWEFDGLRWFRRSVPSPAPRDGFAVAYDPARERIVVYGGFRVWRDQPILLGDLWEWDGAEWTERWGVGGRELDLLRPSLVYDTVRRGLVLFARDLWELNEADLSWTRIETVARPRTRIDAAVAFDIMRRRTVIFGGEGYRGELSDTWELTSQVVTNVTPDSGSEGGNDFVTVRGFGFGPASEMTVRFGGNPASILDVRPDAIRVRTPAGRGEVVVEVSSSRGISSRRAAFAYADPSMSARQGNVNVGSGDREDVLFVNGSAGTTPSRETLLSVGAPIAITLRSPSSRLVAPFALYLWRGAPTDLTLDDSRFDIGLTVFPTPLSSSSPQPRAIWMNVAGKERVLGTPTLPSSPAPVIVFESARGSARPGTFTLQGFIRDDASGIPEGLSVTNAVIVRIE